MPKDIEEKGQGASSSVGSSVGKNFASSKATTTQATRKELCRCNHEAPGKFTFTSPTFSKATAIRVVQLGQSGTQTWDFAVEELSRHHCGELSDINGKSFRFRSDDPTDAETYDKALREDQKSHINRIKAKACDSWKGTYRLQRRMIYPMMLLWFALEVHDCRTTGSCSGAPSRPE